VLHEGLGHVLHAGEIEAVVLDEGHGVW
jgi:hypothetical protein